MAISLLPEPCGICPRPLFDFFDLRVRHPRRGLRGAPPPRAPHWGAPPPGGRRWPKAVRQARKGLLYIYIYIYMYMYMYMYMYIYIYIYIYM